MVRAMEQLIEPPKDSYSRNLHVLPFCYHHYSMLCQTRLCPDGLVVLIALRISLDIQVQAPLGPLPTCFPSTGTSPSKAYSNGLTHSYIRVPMLCSSSLHLALSVTVRASTFLKGEGADAPFPQTYCR
jgi:hypothetical protein